VHLLPRPLYPRGSDGTHGKKACYSFVTPSSLGTTQPSSNIRTSNHAPIVSSSICYSNLYNSSCTGTSSDEGSAAGVAVADVSTVSDVVEADSSGRSVASDIVAVEVAVFLGLALGIRLFPSRMT
jgi:hypothetical protein